MQQMFEQIEPNEHDLAEMAMAQPLDQKIEQAVMLLQHWNERALRENDQGFWLAYSGGKDSDCILELAKMASVDYQAVYNVTTIDPPELIYYMREHHPEVVFNKPEMHMMTKMARDKSCGPPTRLVRWCCDEYKEHGGDGMVKILGVRAAESPRRNGLWRTVQNNRRMGKILCPIVYWTAKDVWDFHKLRNLHYCRLYDEGFKRLGCIGCPMGGPKSQAREFARWPRYEKMWKKGFERFWNNWHGVPTRTGTRRWFEDFGSWENLWDWWISGSSKDSRNECQGMSLFT